MGGHLQIWKVAEILDCSKRFVYTLVSEGHLIAIRLGSRGMRIKKESLEVYLSQNEINNLKKN